MSEARNMSAMHRADKNTIDRNNLILLSRMAIRSLIEVGMAREDRTLVGGSPELVNLLIILEMVLYHGVRGCILWNRKGEPVWLMLRKLAVFSKDLLETVECVEYLPNAPTYVSRVRAWISLVVMQNKLVDYLSLLTDGPMASAVADFCYEEWALLRHESTATAFVGSLLGLRAIRYEICLKEQNFEEQSLDVDLSLLIKLPSFPLDDQSQSDDSDLNRIDPKLKSLLDQMSYLEERIALLQSSNEKLKSRIEHNDSSVEVKESPYRNANPVEELEVALSLIETDVHQKQDTICSLREQLTELKNINADLYKQLRCVESTKREKEILASKLTERYSAAERRCQELMDEDRAKLNKLEQQLADSRCGLQTFETELERSTRLCRELQTRLEKDKEEKIALEAQLESLRKENVSLTDKLNVLTDTEQNNRELRAKVNAMAKQIIEYERALEEVGVHLSQSKLRVEDLKEGLLPFVDVRWEDDRNVTDCQKCRSKFSVSRRKHHCRHCGGIFCQQCSENTLPLPSSSKPARVCDGCFNLLLDRLTSKIAISPLTANDGDDDSTST